MEAAVKVLLPTSKHSPLISLLVAKFRELEPGGFLTYADIERTLRLSKDDQLFRYVVSNSINRVLKDDGIVMVNVRTVGYQRATSAQTANTAVKRGIPKIRRAAKRVGEKVRTVNPMDPSLPEDVRKDAMTAILTTGAVLQFTGRPAVEGFKRQALETVKSPSSKELLPKI